MSETLKVDGQRATWRRIDDEIVVLDLGASAYLSINAAGAAVWPLLEVGTTKSAMVQALLDEFEIDEVTASADVDAFVADLMARRLLIDSAAASSVADDQAVTSSAG